MHAPDFQVKGKVAIVTGAGQGIGRAIALGLAGAGASVALVDIDAAALNDVAREIAQADGTARVYEQDLGEVQRDPGLPQNLVRDIVAQLGPVDILVNNAGIRVHKRVLDHTLEDIERVMRINSTVPLLLCQAAAQVMRAHGGGSIVNITSQMAEVTSPYRVAYCASKAALNQMTRVMAVDLAEYGIRVNAVAPGPTKTPFTNAASATGAMPVVADQVPLGRMGEAEEIVGAVLYFASSASSFTTGTVLTVDGGQSVRWR